MQRAHSGMLRHDQQLGHSQQIIGHQSLFSSQEQLQNVHETSDFMASAPSDAQQLATNQLEAQSDSRIYYEQCPKHGGPTRSPESNEDVVGAVAVRPEEMEEIYRWLYDNIELFGDDEKQDQAVLIIKQGLVDHTLVSDPEINLAATMIRLARMK